MRNVIGLALAALLAGPAWGQEAAKKKIEMAPAITLGFAGVKIAIPADFELQGVGSPEVVLQAVKKEDDVSIFSARLSVFPLGPEAKAEALAKGRRDLTRADVRARGFEVRGSTKTKVAGVDCHIEVQSYRWTGVTTTALRAYFIRPTSDSNLQLAYELTIEAQKKYGKGALAILGAMLGEIELLDPVPPLSEKIDSFGEPIISKKWGYQIRPPKFWKAQVAGARYRLVMWQTNYVPGGGAGPQASFGVAGAEGRSVKEIAEDMLKADQDQIARQGYEHTLHHHRPVKVAGLDGQEILLSYVIPSLPDDAPAGPQRVVIARQFVNLSGKTYWLRLEAITDDHKLLQGILRKIAGTLKLTPTETTTMPSATQPATVPATQPTTAPASTPATAPSTTPASAPATVEPATKSANE